MLVFVFCCFCISGFPAIKSSPKILGKIYKKSAQQKLPESPKERRRGNPSQLGGQVARHHPEPRQGPSWLTGGSPRCPPPPIFSPRGGNPKYRSDFREFP